MVFRDGKPWMSFGVMGGDMQPQGQVQVLLNMLEFGMNVQDAGEAPRFRHFPAEGVALESGIDPTVIHASWRGAAIRSAGIPGSLAAIRRFRLTGSAGCFWGAPILARMARWRPGRRQLIR